MKALKERKKNRAEPEVPLDKRIRIYADQLLQNANLSDADRVCSYFDERKKDYSVTPYLKDIQDVAVFTKYDPKAKELILFLLKKSKMIEHGYAKAIFPILNHESKWLRDPFEWKVSTKNAERQFSSFLRHIFCKYKDVPLFMDKAWLSGAGQNIYINWFIELGLGKNIRTLEGLPVPITKKQAHYFMKAPKKYTPLGAIRFGHILSLGGNERMADCICATTLGTSFIPTREHFWESVFRFFINNPMLDMDQYRHIMDYISNQKYVFVDGQAIQPNFSMKDRNVDTLLAQVEEWHKRLGRMKGDNTNWESSNKPPLMKVEGKNEKEVTYRIEEILTKKELIAEGKELGHCVASYASSCKEGRCSIWSLNSENINGRKRLITIEVRNNAIMQTSGKFNQRPNHKEKLLINEWAINAGIGASYLR